MKLLSELFNSTNKGEESRGDDAWLKKFQKQANSELFIKQQWRKADKLAGKNESAKKETIAMLQGIQNLTSGFVAIILMSGIGEKMLASVGWLISALTTPAIVIITGVGIFIAGFFNSAVKSDDDEKESYLFGVVLAGLIAVVFSKSVKYSLFD